MTPPRDYGSCSFALFRARRAFWRGGTMFRSVEQHSRACSGAAVSKQPVAVSAEWPRRDSLSRASGRLYGALSWAAGSCRGGVPFHALNTGQSSITSASETRLPTSGFEKKIERLP